MQTGRIRAFLPTLLVVGVLAILLAPRILARRGPDSAPTAASSSGPLVAHAPAFSGDGGLGGMAYPKGRWRLALPEELHQVVLTVSHIVIAHRSSHPTAEYHLRPLNWRPDPPNPERTEEAALEMATTLAERLNRHPEEFETIARKSSDDVLTRDAGGSLGSVRATQLPQRYLDALATLEVGQVSRVIRTPLGFTIVKKRAPPADNEISAQRILVSHRDAYRSPSDKMVSRTREEARGVAQGMMDRLRSGAATFDALLRESDTIAATPAGDIGVWKTRDSQQLSRHIEALSRMRVGEISDPIESVFGFEILQRTEVTVRRRYAMQSIQIRIDEKDDGKAGELADSLVKRLDGHPELFDALLEEHCCTPPQQWSSGRGPAGLDLVLDQLDMDQIAKKPSRSGWFYHIPKRLDPSLVPPEPPLQFELPSPVAAKLSPMIEGGEGAFLASRARDIAKEVLASLKLEATRASEVSLVFEELAHSFEANPGVDAGAVRVLSWERAQAGFLKALGPVDYRRLDDAINAWTARVILGGPT